LLLLLWRLLWLRLVMLIVLLLLLLLLLHGNIVSQGRLGGDGLRGGGGGILEGLGLGLPMPLMLLRLLMAWAASLAACRISRPLLA